MHRRDILRLAAQQHAPVGTDHHHHRDPPPPDEEEEDPSSSNSRRALLLWADGDDGDDDAADELSLCSRDLDIKSAAAGSKQEQAPVVQLVLAPPDLDRCISATSSSCCDDDDDAERRIAPPHHHHRPEDPPGTRPQQQQSYAMLHSMERLLVHRPSILDDDDDDKNTEKRTEVRDNNTTTTSLNDVQHRAARKSPGKSEMRKKLRGAKETTKPSGKSGGTSSRDAVTEQEKNTTTTHLVNRLSDVVVDLTEHPLAAAGAVVEDPSTSMRKAAALDPEETKSRQHRRCCPPGCLNIAKMESANQKAAAHLPVVYAQSVGSTQAERLDWANVTRGHQVLGQHEKNAAAADARGQEEQGDAEQPEGEDEVVNKNRKHQFFTRKDDRQDASGNTTCQSQNDASSARGSSTTATCTSKDVTEKAGTARKKLMDVKNIGARKLPPAYDELTEFDKFCGMIGAMLLCE